MVPPTISASAPRQNQARYARSPSPFSSNASPAFSQDNAKFLEQTEAEQATMNRVAQDTGGEAIYNTNGLKEAIEHVIHLGSNYYTIAYTPTNSKYDGQFRKTTVQVSLPDTKLSYRHGYYADDPNAPQKQAVSSIGPVQVTMRRGSPDATQIPFIAHVLPADPQPDLSNPASRNGEQGAKLKGAILRYRIDWGIDVHHIGFTNTSDGHHQASLLLAIVGYDTDSKLLNSEVKIIQLSIPGDVYAKIVEQGFPYHQELDLPKGEFFLRLGIFDQATSKAGAMEVPIAVVQQR